ncbi:MAG: peroxidase-related enzyme [Bacteroidota bacterium]
MSFIKVIQHEDAEGRLREIYDDLVEKRGKLAEVHKIQSLNPETIVAHMDLYMKVMFGKSPLRRYQREMMAVVVSQSNQCPYCIRHHAEALLHFWKDEQKVEQLGRDYNQLELSERDRLLCDLAKHLTIQPAFEGQEALLEKIRQTGLPDQGLLDATLVIAYFNFVNRIVLGLGVQIEADRGTGYKYD